jgi:hypothetical protein
VESQGRSSANDVAQQRPDPREMRAEVIPSGARVLSDRSVREIGPDLLLEARKIRGAQMLTLHMQQLDVHLACAGDFNHPIAC